MIRLVVVLALLIAACGPAGADEAPQWVVSLNLCTDQMLLLLAPEKIAGLSPLALDPAISFVAAEAHNFPTVRPSAESVLSLAPDLVLAGPFGAQTTLTLLEQRGVRIVRAPIPRNFDEIRDQLRALADLLDVPARGEELEGKMDALLAAAPRRAVPPHALMWGAAGWSSGPDTLGGAVLAASGFANASSGGRIALETVAARPPDLLVVTDPPDFPSLATAMLQHPALRGIPRVTIPPSLLICGGPFTALAVKMLSVQVLAP